MNPKKSFKQCVVKCNNSNCVSKCINKNINIPKNYKVIVAKKR